MTAIEVEGRALHFEWISEASSHLALVVLNTVTGDARTWKRLYMPLAKRLPIVSLDVTNRGLSTFTGRPVTFREQLEDVRVLLHEAGISQPVWVGYSAGTSLAYRAAATFPGTIGLILLAPLFSLGMELKIRLLRAILIETLADDTLKQFHNLCSAFTYSGHYLDLHPAVVPIGLARLRALFTVESLLVACEQTFFPEGDDVALLAQVTCPALVVRPEEDQLVPRGAAERVACWLARCWLKEVPGGHRLLEEAPEMTFELIAWFIEKVVTDSQAHGGKSKQY